MHVFRFGSTRNELFRLVPRLWEITVLYLRSPEGQVRRNS